MDRRIYDNYVLQIAAHGSLTRAAAALKVSQPALSSGLSSLEKELGFKIFDRKSVPISFTPEGTIYFDYIQRLQVLTEDLNRRIEDYRDSKNSSVTIGGPVAYVESIVTDAVIRLRRQNPGCRVFIKSAPMAELIDMARKGQIHCFVSTSDRLPEGFEQQLIRREKVYLCIPRSNPLNDRLAHCRVQPGQTGADFDYSCLDGQNFIFLEPEQPLQLQTEAFLQAHSIAPRHSVTVNQVSTAVNLAIRGEGICFASESALESNLDLSDVCIYSLPDTISGRSLYIAYNRELFMPEACKALLRFLVQKTN